MTNDHWPSALPGGFPTWAVLLLPYMEQQNVYALVDLAVPLDEHASPPADHQQLLATNIPTYCCRLAAAM